MDKHETVGRRRSWAGLGVCAQTNRGCEISSSFASQPSAQYIFIPVTRKIKYLHLLSFEKMMRSNITKLAVRRFGSSAVAKDTPREAVARNLLLHKAISEAKTEEQLAKLVAAPLPALTTEGVQQLGLADYLQRDFAPSVTKFTPDPTAWQNMKGADYVFTEAQRSETWPFLVGLGYVDNVETSC